MTRLPLDSHVVSIPKKSLKERSARGFKTKVRGRIFNGLVVRAAGKYYAYENLCQHLPITLDLGDNEFFTHDRSHLQCHMHGATYEIESGVCVGGPCLGAKLRQLELIEEEAELVIKIPGNF